MLNDTLRQVPLFAQLNDDELSCFEQGEEFDFHQEKNLLLKGIQQTIFYVLLEGQVRVTKKVSTNKETIIASHDSGTVLRKVFLTDARLFFF